MTIDMSQFFQVFFEETAEHLANMESLLLELDVGTPDDEQLNAIFRAAHSIKGSSGTFGFADLADVTHVLENLLDRIRKHELALRTDMVDAFLEAGDTLKAMLAAHQGGEAVDPATIADITGRLQALTRDAVAPVVSASPAAAAPEGAASGPPPDSTDGRRCHELQFFPTAEAIADPEVLDNFLDDLAALGAVEVLARPPAGEQGLWHLRLTAQVPREKIEDILSFISERDAWRIDEPVLSGADDVEGAFGFFEPPAAAEDDSFGFFDPLPDGEPTSASSGAADAASAPLPAEDGGAAYGFFEPLPVAGDTAAPAVPDGPVAATPVVVEEGDGFGFFAPLPDAPPAAAAEVSPPATRVRPPETPPPVAVPPAPPPAEKPAEVAEKAVDKAARARPPAAPAGESASIRVSVERADQLINLVGELVITQAMLLQCAAQMQEAAPEELINGLAQLERNTRGLQEAVMSIRMMPISFVFSRFPRVVRDLSSKLGKQVELKMSGETTELDKGLIERIADPLNHLIRNSLDHGIEPLEKRIAAGKSPVGTITLKAAHQGGNIVIEVGDDGAGLNRQKILAKARERGLQVSDQMSDQDVWALIFDAGFSTADAVTDVSGRGVGMDVVRRNIQEMGGRIEIESMLGIGTRMTVRLPLTLAILDGMSVAVGDQTYILPLSYVVESLQPLAGDVKTLSNQGRVIQVRGDFLPVVALHEAFRVAGAETDFTRGIMIVLDADGAKAALFVDALVGQHQVVIKSLEQNYRRVPGISGATIMGDGRVAMILDVSALIEAARTSQPVAMPASA